MKVYDKKRRKLVDLVASMRQDMKIKVQLLQL